MKEVVYTSQMKLSRWSGGVIQEKKECGTCPFHRQVIDDANGKTKPEWACVRGVAWKRLCRVEKPRKCTELSKPRPEFHCMWRID